MVVGFEISGASPSLDLGSKSIGEMCTLLLSGFKSRDWLVYTAIYTKRVCLTGVCMHK